MSQILHSISTVSLDDTFLTLYQRVNDSISVINQIRIYDVQGTGGILHKRQVVGVPAAVEVLSINLAATGGLGYGYGLGMINLQNPTLTVGDYEGNTYAVRLDYNAAQESTAFIGASGATVSVEDTDYVLVAATGSRGDNQFRPLKVFAKDSLPYNITGEHRFLGNVFFDGGQVVVNSAQLHIDDNLLYIASAGNTDNPSFVANLSSNAVLAGGSGSGLVVKGASGDKFITYQNSGSEYYSFRVSENLQTDGSFVSPTGDFTFVGVSGSAPSISLRTTGQDSATVPIGWKIYQSVTGGSVGSLKVKREGLTDFNTLELFTNSEVMVGQIHQGGTGAATRSGSFTTHASKFAVPGTNNTGVLHYGWQNRDVVELAATADGGRFAETISAFKDGTVLTFNDLGQYKRARWDADPSTGYKDAEVVGILESKTDDFVLTVPLQGGSTYTTSLFSLNESVNLKSALGVVRGYVYANLPAAGISGISVFVDSFPTGVTAGSFVPSGSFFVGGATLSGINDEDAMGICGSHGVTVATKSFAVIVRQGLFDIPALGSGATGYDAVYGLTAGYLMYLGGTMSGNDTNCYGGVTYASGNLFDPQEFYVAGANVAKPVFIYLGEVEGRKTGLFQPYQGLGLTYSITSADTQPVYYDTDTGEIQNFDLIGDVGGRNKITNSGFDIWSRLDTYGSTYYGTDGAIVRGITFNATMRSTHPLGTTYSASDASSTIVSGFITDTHFFDTLNRGNNRLLKVERQPVTGSALSSLAYPPSHELKITQIGDTNTGNPRLYAIVPDHRTLSDHDFNFSFYAKSNAGVSMGITAGVVFVWNAGASYAVIESTHAFLSSGSGTSGGNFYTTDLTSDYTRYQFSFSSESLTYAGATGINNSFVAPFIELKSGILADEESLSITGMQLSKGISVKPYQKRSYAEEKIECDRYFQNVVIAHGGYYPVQTGASGPSLFTATNFSIPFVVTPTALSAVDVISNGMIGASAGTDPETIRKNSISVFRETDTTSSTYHRYFETVYTLDASGFSGAVSSRLQGLI